VPGHDRRSLIRRSFRLSRRCFCAPVVRLSWSGQSAETGSPHFAAAKPASALHWEPRSAPRQCVGRRLLHCSLVNVQHVLSLPPSRQCVGRRLLHCSLVNVQHVLSLPPFAAMRWPEVTALLSGQCSACPFIASFVSFQCPFTGQCSACPFNVPSMSSESCARSASGDANARRSEPKPKLGPRASDQGFLPIEIKKYLMLLDWTGRELRQDKYGAIPDHLAPILDRVGLERSHWVETVRDFGRMFKQAAGRWSSLARTAPRCSRRWFQGKSAARLAFL
jgi:hypothetical protein